MIAMCAMAVFGMSVNTAAQPVIDPDFTPAMGPFGFTTQGLGASPSYGEPSLRLANDGQHAIVCTPGSDDQGNGGVQYWYSANDGNNWNHSISSYPGGGGDCGLDILPNGRILDADLAITESGINYSDDWGATWSSGSPAGTEQDRQWLAHSDDGSIQYLVYHDFVVEGEFISHSTDGGQTWTTSAPSQYFVNSVDQVSALPILLGGHAGSSASIFDQGVNTFSGPLLVQGNDMYVVYSISDVESNLNPQQGIPPYGPVRALVVAHSNQGGLTGTWTNVLADVATIQGVDESVEGTMFPWGFLDPAGNVYVVFASTRDDPSLQHFHEYYVVSTDKGMTWSDPVRLDDLENSTGSTAYAAGAAVSPGVIDIAWYQAPDGTVADDTGVWTPHFAQVTGAAGASPQITRQAITTVPNHAGGICLQGILCGFAPGSSDRSLLDFFQLEVNPVTHKALIAYADNFRLGVNDNGDKIGEVVVARETGTAPAPPPAAPEVVTQLPDTSAFAPAGQGLLLVAAGLLAPPLLMAGVRRRRKPRSPS
ncbi:MAG: repeat-like domain [Chloroflexota bacterium]|nr:repeat-like domain [Chloroflexota bacterium]